jgi:hypothetical protein
MTVGLTAELSYYVPAFTYATISSRRTPQPSPFYVRPPPPTCTTTCGECAACQKTCTIVCSNGFRRSYTTSCCGYGNWICVDNACTCPAPNTVCGTSNCTDIQSDPANCGTCGNRCPSGQSCFLGACGRPCDVIQWSMCDRNAIEALDACTQTQPQSVCVAIYNATIQQCTAQYGCPDPNTACCDVICNDLESDPANCGSCRNACASGEVCCNGTCCAPLQECCNGTCCAPLQECCSDACTSTQTDPANCGTCGHSCGNGNWTCSSGNCSCPNTVCNGNNCTDTQTDPVNCGGCGNHCDKEGQQCQFGQCVCVSPYSPCSPGPCCLPDCACSCQADGSGGHYCGCEGSMCNCKCSSNDCDGC